MNDRLQPDQLREIEQLVTLARWYREWADVANTEPDRAARLRLAEEVERRVRQLCGRAVDATC